MVATLSKRAVKPAAPAEANVCVLCGKTFMEFGNNPYPLATLDDGECCDDCNGTRVLPARILARIQSRGR